jgi:hypothetical protein
MKESTRAALLIALIAFGSLVAYFFFLRPFMQEQPKVQQVINANSTWSVTMQEYELKGLLAEETYRISNNNGKTTMFYAGTNRAGTVTKEFTEPLNGPDGTFLFEQLRADGLWDLDNLSVRPHPVEEYVIEAEQTLGDEGGSRAFSFSDPEYWATTHAQEYQLKLPPKGPISGPNSTILSAGGRKLQDPRYLKIVFAIKHFGPPTVLAAEAKIRAALAETAKHPVPPR